MYMHVLPLYIQGDEIASVNLLSDHLLIFKIYVICFLMWNSEIIKSDCKV